jgi:hypothetical protein
MPKNKVDDLRNHLFDTLEALRDPEKPMDVARAKAISDIAQTIINSAKVEVDFLKATNLDGSSEFFESSEQTSERRKRLTNGRNGGH